MSTVKKSILEFLAITLGLLALSLPAQTLNAQSLLQNSGGTLQPQSGQTQQTNNSQRQTDSPQTSGNQSALSTENAQSLGVVSDPQQNNPDAVVQPSSELRANNYPSQANQGSSSVKLVVGFLAVLLAVGLAGYRFSRFDFKGQNIIDEPLDRIQLAQSLKNPATKPAKKKKSKKKRRKPHQR